MKNKLFAFLCVKNKLPVLNKMQNKLYVYSWENILISSNFSAFGPRRWSIFGVFIRLHFLLNFFSYSYYSFYIFFKHIAIRQDFGRQPMSFNLYVISQSSQKFWPAAKVSLYLYSAASLWYVTLYDSYLFFLYFFKILFTKWPADKFSQSLSSFLLNK